MKTTPLWITALSALALGGAFSHPLQAEAKERSAPLSQDKKVTKRITVVINGKRFQVEDTGKPLQISIEKDGKHVSELNLMLDGEGRGALQIDGERLKMGDKQFKSLKEFVTADGLKFKIDAQHFKELEKLHNLNGLKPEGLAKIYRLDAEKLKGMEKMDIAPLADLPLLWDGASSGEVKKALSAARKSLSEQLKRTSDSELKKSLEQAIKAMDDAIKGSGSSFAPRAMLAPKMFKSYMIEPGTKVWGSPDSSSPRKFQLKVNPTGTDFGSLVKSLTPAQRSKMKEKGLLNATELTPAQLEMLGVKPGSDSWEVTVNIDGAEYRFSSK